MHHIVAHIDSLWLCDPANVPFMCCSIL